MKKLLLLSFPNNMTRKAVTYTLVKEYDLVINILRASIDYNIQGFLLIEVEGKEDSINEGIAFLEEDIDVTIITSAIIVDDRACVNCGACTAVCPVDALSMDAHWQLQFDSEKCVDCKLCVRACPVRAITAVL